MTTLDQLLDELAAGVSSLSERAVVALFWTCAVGLRAEAQKWAALRGASEAPLEEALTAARRFATTGARPAEEELAAMLSALEASTPHGDSPDEFSHTEAQDCWICADVAIRVLADQQFEAAPVIEYALEPILQRGSEELFGVSQVGSGDEEETQVRAILAHPAVVGAVDLLRWALGFLRERPSPTSGDLALLRSQATVLAPQGATWEPEG